MPAYDFANFQNLFKIVYDGKEVRSLVAENFKILDMLGKFEQPPVTGGKHWEFLVETGWTPSVGAMAYSGATPTPGVGSWAPGKVYIRQRAASYQIEYAGLQLSRENPQAFLSEMKAARDNIAKRIRDHKVKQFLGGNAGTLAVVNGNQTASTIAVEGMLGYTKGNGTFLSQGAEVFRIGDTVVFDPGGAPQYKTLTGVDKANGTISFSGAITVTDGMRICNGESGRMDYLNSMDGLYDLYNAAATYETIAPGSYPAWAPHVYTGATPGTEEPLSSKHINNILIDPESESGAQIDVIGANTKLIQAFMDMYEAQIRFEPGKFAGGMQTASWDIMGRKPKLMFDPQFPHNTLFGLETKALLRFVAREGRWLDEDGSELKWVPNTTQYIAVWAELDNVGTKLRNHFAIQKDIEEP